MTGVQTCALPIYLRRAACNPKILSCASCTSASVLSEVYPRIQSQSDIMNESDPILSEQDPTSLIFPDDNSIFDVFNPFLSPLNDSFISCPLSPTLHVPGESNGCFDVLSDNSSLKPLGGEQSSLDMSFLHEPEADCLSYNPNALVDPSTLALFNDLIPPPVFPETDLSDYLFPTTSPGESSLSDDAMSFGVRTGNCIRFKYQISVCRRRYRICGQLSRERLDRVVNKPLGLPLSCP